MSCSWVRSSMKSSSIFMTMVMPIFFMGHQECLAEEDDRGSIRQTWCSFVTGILVVLGSLVVVAPASAQMMGNMGSGMGQASPRSTSAAAGSQTGASNKKKEMFLRVCSSCHAAPDPRLHAPDQWPQVVRRMKRYMSSSNLPLPDKKTFHEIKSYLEEHAN